MPSEITIRSAIAAKIKTAAPTAVVVPRNILGIKSDGWYGLLQSPDDDNRVHGWMVTQAAQTIAERRQAGAEYALKFLIWQFYQYRTGNDSSNSEDEASTEREAVIATFVGELASPLSWADPLEFGLIDIFPTGDGGKLIHIAQGSITVHNVAGCA